MPPPENCKQQPPALNDTQRPKAEKKSPSPEVCVIVFFCSRPPPEKTQTKNTK
jgi:hypothetical protein